MRFVNKIGEWNGNTQRAVWINLNQLKLNNSTCPSDFSIRINSIKTFSGRIISYRYQSQKMCKTMFCSFLSKLHPRGNHISLLNPPSMRTHFAAVEAKLIFIFTEHAHTNYVSAVPRDNSESQSEEVKQMKANRKHP